MKLLLLVFLLTITTIAHSSEMVSTFSRGNIQISANKNIVDISSRISYGSDKNRITILSEADNNDWQNSILYSRYLNRFWDIETGITKIKENNTLLPSIGVNGLLPYYIEIEFLLIFDKDIQWIDNTASHKFQLTNYIIYEPKILTKISLKNGEVIQNTIENSLKYETNQDIGFFIKHSSLKNGTYKDNRITTGVYFNTLAF